MGLTRKRLIEMMKEERTKVKRCKICLRQLTILEDAVTGKTRLWCINCEGGQK